MKKFIVSTMALFSVIFILTGCGKKADDKKAEEPKTTQKSDKKEDSKKSESQKSETAKPAQESSKKSESKKPVAPKPAPNTSKPVDFKSTEELKTAMDSGKDVTGKTVTFKIDEVVPNGTFGYTFSGSKEVAFISKNAPGIPLKPGDTVTLKINTARMIVGSWIITYEDLRKG